MVKKRLLYQSKHPLDSFPFEALCKGSWQTVKSISIKNATVTLNFLDNEYLVKQKGPFPNLRIRSRRATLSDCTCFLRPGVDICVISTSQQAKSRNEELKHPVWLNARISSIERRPHEYGCSCHFYVNLYINQGTLGSETSTLNRESVSVGINEITILQKLGRNSCEDKHFRWYFSEDCSLLPKSKLLLGKFLTDFSWLLVTSCFKPMAFDVRSVHNKIVYQILGCNMDSKSSNSNGLNAVNFREDNAGTLVAIVVQFDLADTIEVDPSCEAHGNGSDGLSELVSLRRSKRRNVQPDRFFGCDTPSHIEIGYVQARPYKIDHRMEENEMPLPQSSLDSACASRLMAHTGKNPKVHSSKTHSSDSEDPLQVFKMKTTSTKKKLPGKMYVKKEPRVHSSDDSEDSLVSKNNTTSMTRKSHSWKTYIEKEPKVHSREARSSDSEDSQVSESNTTLTKKSHSRKNYTEKKLKVRSSEARSSDLEDILVSKSNITSRTKKSHSQETCAKKEPKIHSREMHSSDSEDFLVSKSYTTSRTKKSHSQTTYAEKEAKVETHSFDSEDSPVTKSKNTSRKKKSGLKSQKQHQAKVKIEMVTVKPETLQPRCPSSYYYAKSNPKVHRKNVPDLEELELGNMWDGKGSNRSFQNRKHRSPCFKDSREKKTYPRRTIGEYDHMINSVLKNIDCRAKKEPNVIDRWKEIRAKCSSDQKSEAEDSATDNEEEMSETEVLWKEMELALASTYILDDNEVSRGTDGIPNSCCQHAYKVDDEIGIFCDKCGFVKTEIRYVSPPFVQKASYISAENKSFDEDLGKKSDEDDQIDAEFNHCSPKEELLEEGSENVWALIPELSKKLHLHQKKAFEFLWQNIAGSLEPASMSQASKRIGGCVISHSPGAGKTFLIITFLVSYLKLFPGKRPLVLAPKTTLYTWHKEFIKWKIPTPVYLIHGRKTYNAFSIKSMHIPGFPMEKPTVNVMHILDCIEKIQKWHAQPSVLLMSYSSFLMMMREDSKFSHRRFMAKVLRESPGIMVLDEGHNPRSSGSKLRKVLMKVKTELRILLSGTLFQNNLCEYFNTLCLARPKFINEVLKELDPKYKMEKNAGKACHLLEKRARRYFLDDIAKKINSEVRKERTQGLNTLKKITNGFIDAYEPGGSDNLPGLQIYTVLLNSTDVQQEVLVKLLTRHNVLHLELELLVTLISIHPWLVKTSKRSHKILSSDELKDLEEHKYNTRKGSKVKFVLNLVYRVVNKEKVLIFCHNIEPLKLLGELFEQVFGWQRGKQVLVLTGDLDLFERGRVMDLFEEPGGDSKVLLASITACAEGISLTSASRVILMDSAWNPSKTKQAIARAFRPGQQKVVYVYQLLATGSLEEAKYKKTTWKEWMSCLIVDEARVEDPSKWQAQKIEDEILREMVAEDTSKSIHMIMKNEKDSTANRGKGKAKPRQICP